MFDQSVLGEFLEEDVAEIISNRRALIEIAAPGVNRSKIQNQRSFE